MIERDTIDEPELRDVVRFFSFVVFRVGLGIAACRYALAGQTTRLAHRELRGPKIEPDNEPPNLLLDGVNMTLPVNPPVSLVNPADAPESVAHSYRRLCRELDTPKVNHVFQAFATNPTFLDTVVDAQVATNDGELELSRKLLGLYAVALNENPNLPLFRPTLSKLSESDIVTVERTLRTYHENLPTLLLTVYLAAQLASP
jgi:hypothetical protein